MIVRIQPDLILTEAKRFRSGLNPVFRVKVSAITGDSFTNWWLDPVTKAGTQWVYFMGVLVRMRGHARGWIRQSLASH
jgi:hypothetical protein